MIKKKIIKFQCISKNVNHNLVKTMSPAAARLAMDPISVKATYFQGLSPPSTMQSKIDFFLRKKIRSW